MKSDENYLAVLKKQIRGQNEALLENQKVLLGAPDQVAELSEQVTLLHETVLTIRAAVSDTSEYNNPYEGRLTKLEKILT